MPEWPSCIQYNSENFYRLRICPKLICDTPQTQHLVWLRIVVTLLKPVLVFIWENSYGFKFVVAYVFGLSSFFFSSCSLKWLIFYLNVVVVHFLLKHTVLKGMRPLFSPPQFFLSFICYHIHGYTVPLIFCYFFFFRGGTWLWIYVRQVSPKEFYVSSSPTKRGLYNIMHVPIVIWEINVLFWGNKIWSVPLGIESTTLSVTFADQNINLIYVKCFPLLLCMFWY